MGIFKKSQKVHYIHCKTVTRCVGVGPGCQTGPALITEPSPSSLFTHRSTRPHDEYHNEEEEEDSTDVMRRERWWG